jgi:tetratricopeptide (TPR) repeat protein
MKPLLARPLAFCLIVLLFTQQNWATCGGGGGGGVGGMGGGNGMSQTYPVPWKLIKADDPPVSSGLVVYWFPSSVNEFQKSSLRESRVLSVYSQQCVTMGVADIRTPIGQKLASDAKLPIVVMASPDGTPVGKLENTNGMLKVEQVEKLVETEVKKRKESVEQQLKAAKEKSKSGDSQAAIQTYRAVVEQKCMFPDKAKDAAKELKKLGVTDVADIPDAPSLDPKVSAKIVADMRKGLQAENDARYLEAERLYSAAHHLDPADPAPLRFLGELYRHHIGDWDKARQTFDAILNMPADPLSRAVAMHGLGKMTIHEGDFKKGLGLMEASVREYPLALAYRNLAVYWNSEGDAAKADHYTREALAIDPHDAYNLIFAAAFMAGNGHGDEALKIARENEAMLPASYNLAAIYAQLGQKDKALSLLKRHFFEYERYQAVRSKEMMEARVDAVFASLRTDSAFLQLTSGADGRLPMPMSKSSR